MKDLEEKENKKKNIDSLDNVLNNMSTVEKMADEIMKGLHFIVFCLILLVIIVFIFVRINELSDIVLYNKFDDNIASAAHNRLK